MSFIALDVYEPGDLERLLSQYMQVKRENLVDKGLLDCFWFTNDGHSVTMERKEIHDLIGNLPRLEKQLRVATNHADEVGLIVEGVTVPLTGGEIAIYQIGHNPKYLRQTKISPMQYSSIIAYIWQLKRTANITTYWTSTINGTAIALKTFVENSQKQDSSIMQHYVRTRQIKWQANPMVETIMSLKDEDGYIVGEKKAAELIQNVGSLWDIIHLPPEEINFACNGIGLKTAQRLIDAVKGKKKK